MKKEIKRVSNGDEWADCCRDEWPERSGDDLNVNCLLRSCWLKWLDGMRLNTVLNTVLQIKLISSDEFCMNRNGLLDYSEIWTTLQSVRRMKLEQDFRSRLREDDHEKSTQLRWCLFVGLLNLLSCDNMATYLNSGHTLFTRELQENYKNNICPDDGQRWWDSSDSPVWIWLVINSGWRCRAIHLVRAIITNCWSGSVGCSLARWLLAKWCSLDDVHRWTIKNSTKQPLLHNANAEWQQQYQYRQFDDDARITRLTYEFRLISLAIR